MKWRVLSPRVKLANPEILPTLYSLFPTGYMEALGEFSLELHPGGTVNILESGIGFIPGKRRIESPCVPIIIRAKGPIPTVLASKRCRVSHVGVRRGLFWFQPCLFLNFGTSKFVFPK